MTPAEHLRAARALIDTPERWAQHAYNVQNPDGTRCYCMLGALDQVKLDHNETCAFLYAAIGMISIALWNDAPNRTHNEVMAAFDRAIALAEAGQ